MKYLFDIWKTKKQEAMASLISEGYALSVSRESEGIEIRKSGSKRLIGTINLSSRPGSDNYHLLEIRVCNSERGNIKSKLEKFEAENLNSGQEPQFSNQNDYQ